MRGRPQPCGGGRGHAGEAAAMRGRPRCGGGRFFFGVRPISISQPIATLKLHGMHAPGTADAMVSRDASVPALISATFAREMQPKGDKSAYQVELQLRTIDGTFQDISRKS